MRRFSSSGIILFLILILPLLIFAVTMRQQLVGRAGEVRARIEIDTQTITGPLPQTWRALAQGGEVKGERMLANVVPQIIELSPRYIRIDHIYDFYDVVSRNDGGQLILNWSQLDATVCDILASGARPFFSLGYMPPALSRDGSLISAPAQWGDWQYLVEKTIERYSGRNTVLCGGSINAGIPDIYYEVWNEPDLEVFGKWSLYGGDKDYKLLYLVSAQGAAAADNVQQYFLGGPATTAPYANWMKIFLRFIRENNLRIDFLSWHRYSADPRDFDADTLLVDVWLAEEEFARYRSLPRIISEWGYDAQPNPVSESPMGAAHSVTAIRNLIEQDLEMAFLFEIKDGRTPTWGILSSTGTKKLRYHAIKLLDILGPRRLRLTGEGTYVKAIASKNTDEVAVILVNYDRSQQHQETVPVKFNGLTPERNYEMTLIELGGQEQSVVLPASAEGILTRLILMKPNSVVGMRLVPR